MNVNSVCRTATEGLCSSPKLNGVPSSFLKYQSKQMAWGTKCRVRICLFGKSMLLRFDECWTCEPPNSNFWSSPNNPEVQLPMKAQTIWINLFVSHQWFVRCLLPVATTAWSQLGLWLRVLYERLNWMLSFPIQGSLCVKIFSLVKRMLLAGTNNGNDWHH